MQTGQATVIEPITPPVLFPRVRRSPVPSSSINGLLTDAQTLTWLTPPGAERVSRDGLVGIPLLDEQICLETHLATQANAGT
jgi:hypothetical protein